MGKVVIGVGLPGSGKTTILKAFAERCEYVYISPDDIRMELHGDASEQSGMKEVWEKVHLRTLRALRKRRSVVVDATFYKRNERRDFIRFAKDHGAESIEAVFTNISLEVADERNRKRERVVRRHAMERMDKALQAQPPTEEDGFDKVFSIAEFQKKTCF